MIYATEMTFVKNSFRHYFRRKCQQRGQTSFGVPRNFPRLLSRYLRVEPRKVISKSIAQVRHVAEYCFYYVLSFLRAF